MIFAVIDAIFAIAYGSLKNSRPKWGLNLWPHDTGARLQASELYEATDVGSWWFVGSNEPVRNEWIVPIFFSELNISHLLILFVFRKMLFHFLLQTKS